MNLTNESNRLTAAYGINATYTK